MSPAIESCGSIRLMGSMRLTMPARASVCCRRRAPSTRAGHSTTGRTRRPPRSRCSATSTAGRPAAEPGAGSRHRSERRARCRLHAFERPDEDPGHERHGERDVPITIPGSVSMSRRPLKIATSGTSSAIARKHVRDLSPRVRRAPAGEPQRARSTYAPSMPSSVVPIATVVDTRRLLRSPSSMYGIRISWSRARCVVGAGGRTCGPVSRSARRWNAPSTTTNRYGHRDQQHDRRARGAPP